MDSRATPGTSSSPLTELLYGQVERVLARWQEMDGDKSPATGAVDRFLSALAALEEAAGALTGDGAVGDGAPRIDPGPFDEARSYAHLAGLLPRSLEFDAAACVIRQSGGELVTAVPGPGNLLGNLLCGIANLLNGSGAAGLGGALTNVLTQLLNNLTAALALLL